MSRTNVGLAIVALVLAALATPALAASSTESAPLVGQGPGGEVVGTVWLTRTEHGLTIRAEMPTPEPGSYAYPPGAADEGAPEAFTLWAFVFPNPEACADDDGDGVPECGGIPDLIASGGGAFGVAGHLSGGGQLTLAGHISKNTDPFPLPVPGSSKLTNPMGAEVHVAIAPHGTVDPENLPAQITTPIGGPDLWWVALFK